MKTDKELEAILRRAPMGSAPMKYFDDGSVNWGDMWDSYCILAQDGGPPHRGTMLNSAETVDSEHENYQFALSEIIRGIDAVSGLKAYEASSGWVGVKCPTVSMAHWLSEAIVDENVEAKRDGNILLLPVSELYTLKREIKNVITVVAKTTHYWTEHVPAEVKQTLTVQLKFQEAKSTFRGWFSRQKESRV